MNVRTTTAIALIVGLWAGAARADEGAPGGAAPALLTDAEAVRLALSRSRQLERLAGEEAAQEQEVNAAATSFADPQLRFEDLSTRYSDPDVNHQMTVGLRWQPPRIGELPARAQKARVELWTRKVRTADLRVRLAAEARRALAEQALLRDGDALASARVALEERRLSAVESLVALGQRPLVDKVKAARRLVKARRDAARARQRLADGRERLAELTGVSGDADPVPRAPPEADLDLATLHRAALAHRPEVGLAEQRARLADREWAAESLRMLPWFSFLEVGYVHESLKPDWGEFRLGIDLPFSRWNTSRLKSASLAQRAGTREAAATAEVLDREVASALARYREALAAVRSLRADAEGLGRQSDAVLAAARADRSLAADDAVDLELAGLDERQMALEARYDLQAAAADLCAAVGVERWEDLAP